MKTINLLLSLLIISISGFAQSLIDELDQEKPEITYTQATFKANRILLGQSVENIKPGELNFAVMHNFGPLSGGFFEFYGLDAANTALNFEYGMSKNLNLGLGRSTYQKNFEGSAKYKLISQSTKAPVTLSVFGAMYVYGGQWGENENYFENKHRFTYLAQLLIARKFTERISIQLTPTYIHKNLVKFEADENDIFVLYAGGRFKLSNRVTFNMEYSYVLPNQISSDYTNYLGLGFDFDTGGHVFQLRFSNATSLYEPNYLTKNTNNWLDGDISFGFTINRRFTIIDQNSK